MHFFGVFEVEQLIRSKFIGMCSCLGLLSFIYNEATQMGKTYDVLLSKYIWRPTLIRSKEVSSADVENNMSTLWATL